MMTAAYTQELERHSVAVPLENRRRQLQTEMNQKARQNDETQEQTKIAYGANCIKHKIRAWLVRHASWNQCVQQMLRVPTVKI